MHGTGSRAMRACVHTIAIISQKGGAGKTTLALNLAVACHLAGQNAAVIDLDPQASASTWARLRQDPEPAVTSAHAPRLADVLEAARHAGARIAIIDTAPHAQATALAAARAADLVLIPCRPALFDIHAATASRDIAALAATPAAGILWATPPRGSFTEEANAVLTRRGIETAETTIGHRIAHVRAIARGLSVLELEPRGRAAAEIRELHAWTTARLARTGD